MAFHNKIGRFAGGFADFLTGNRFDFDGLGRPKKSEKSENFIEEDDEKDKGRGMLDAFLESYQTYNPEKNKTETDKFLDMMSKRGFASGGGGSFAQVGENLSMFNPDNTLRNQALLEKQRLQAQQAAQAKENRSNVGRMAGAAIGNAIVPGVGGVVGGLLGGLFCDIRLKEDIAPLQKSEVNDVLSECAFFVKDLNELS